MVNVNGFTSLIVKLNPRLYTKTINTSNIMDVNMQHLIDIPQTK